MLSGWKAINPVVVTAPRRVQNTHILIMRASAKLIMTDFTEMTNWYIGKRGGVNVDNFESNFHSFLQLLEIGCYAYSF